MLSIKNITKNFHGRSILTNISLDVAPGEIAVLLGSSGAGKSTLLRILNDLETINSGSITLNGIALDKAKKDHIPPCGMVFQHFNLFDHLTVLENITLALEKTAKKSSEQAKHIAYQLLQQYQLTDKSFFYPSQLSGGQKQRLAIARSIALKPAIMCFDEPTSALDPFLTTHVAQIIQQLATQGYILIIATHDTSLVRKLSCTLYLIDNGSIIERAVSSALYAHPDHYPYLTRFISGTHNEHIV